MDANHHWMAKPWSLSHVISLPRDTVWYQAPHEAYKAWYQLPQPPKYIYIYTGSGVITRDSLSRKPHSPYSDPYPIQMLPNPSKMPIMRYVTICRRQKTPSIMPSHTSYPSFVLGHVFYLIYFCQLGFPYVVRIFSIDVGENEIEHIGIPAGRVTINTLLDILDMLH